MVRRAFTPVPVGTSTRPAASISYANSYCAEPALRFRPRRLNVLPDAVRNFAKWNASFAAFGVVPAGPLLACPYRFLFCRRPRLRLAPLCGLTDQTDPPPRASWNLPKGMGKSFLQVQFTISTYFRSRADNGYDPAVIFGAPGDND